MELEVGQTIYYGGLAFPYVEAHKEWAISIAKVVSVGKDVIFAIRYSQVFELEKSKVFATEWLAKKAAPEGFEIIDNTIEAL